MNYGCVLDRAHAGEFFEKPFDAWLHDNLHSGSNMVSSSMNCGVRFSIWCWLLWKLRCCMVFDEDFSERVGVFEKGCRLSAESERTFGLGEPTQAVEQRCLLSWKDWEVVVKHASRKRNGVVDSLAAMGRDHSMQGSVFLATLGVLAAWVEEERRSWVAMQPTDGVIVDGIDLGGKCCWVL
ncbi:hypothetical protein V6N13_042522 [Hibiscus sabdariffa]|uniref:RNase H type-1 domain-containing protein n=1 Tax=Hibiscus sabdariffa TaxID=183260 RepID=A0ABR2G4D9_9ROSI